jgi:hypothetical protein
VNWFDKIKDLTTKRYHSPDLKKGDIKQILVQAGKELMPGFEFLIYKNSCYTFQRLRQANGLTVYETLHIIFTLKDGNFACSIASRLNPNYIHINTYNLGLINPHKDLKVLRHNTGALNIQDAYYFHNGKVDTTTKTVKEIFSDYKKYGLPFLEKQFQNIQSNEIIKLGLKYIDNLQTDKGKLKNDVESELDKGGLLLSSLKHPIYLDLKEHLQNIGGQNEEDRESIPMAAYELLEIYWTS